MRVTTTIVLAAAMTIAARGAGAQQRYIAEQPKKRFYFSGGLGGGTFTPTCDSGCFGDALNANNVILYAGWSLSSRLRFEAGVQYQPATGEEGSGSHVSSASAGLSFYLLKGLFVRGGVSALSLSVADTVGVTDGHGGPGYTAGAGYDLFLGGSFAITPFVNYFGGTLNSMTYQGAGNTFATKGKLTALNYGVSFTYRPFR